MITPDQTSIQVLGSATIASPLRLAHDSGESPGAFVSDEARVRYQIETGTGHDLPADVFFEKAGPRERLFFEPLETRAAIVTCGGVCPGLNNVIRSAVMEFYYNYGVQQILGIRYGYAGLNPKTGLSPIELTPKFVSDIHEKGGTILGSSRGQQPSDVMADFLVEQKINILLCIGGDGTLRGAQDVAKAVQRRGVNLTVIGIPKTIDNDVMYMSRTFGMTTALEKAHTILDCAHSEARSAYNGVGLVKLMGRDAGFIAAGATLASQEVNFCLIPEVPFVLEGKNGLLEALRRRLESAHHAVVAVAEGAGQDLIKQLPADTDASGNKRYADIGVYLKDQIVTYFKQQALPVDVKYFDPSYFVRSVPANCEDALLCDLLARNAVHAAMAGKTNLVVGFWNGTFIHIPISLAVSQKKQVDPKGALWSSVLATTGQPFEWGN
ncbi:MAG: ATP-dependent 6-phosphofructokinase [Verrucomicrobia bacterium]|nr:ATP-dependent 6-phosphofructokinase [Verrucomicrobiota bacterium]